MPFTRPKASQIDFDVTNISDPLIRLNSGESGSADKDVGLVIEIGRAHVRTPVTRGSRMPSSA